MYRRLFNFVKNKIPRISDTELIALRSGDTSIDRQILFGRVEFPKLSKYQNKFDTKNLINLGSTFDNTNIYPNDNNNRWIEYLAKNKYFSFLIDEKYGGIKLSVNELSDVITKITTIDPALGVVANGPKLIGTRRITN